jgi:hypothetical protein
VTTGFHEDRTPSLQLYNDGSWYCYGACRTGGSIYDFAARLWLSDHASGEQAALKLRGHEFLRVRERLATELRLAPSREPGRAVDNIRTAR